MTHKIVSIVVGLVLLLFVGAALAFAWSVSARAPERAGGQAAPAIPHPVDQATASCGQCHTVAAGTLPVTHRDFPTSSCEACHETLPTTRVPHAATGLEDKCVLCHGDPVAAARDAGLSPELSGEALRLLSRRRPQAEPPAGRRRRVGAEGAEDRAPRHRRLRHLRLLSPRRRAAVAAGKSRGVRREHLPVRLPLPGRRQVGPSRTASPHLRSAKPEEITTCPSTHSSTSAARSPSSPAPAPASVARSPSGSPRPEPPSPSAIWTAAPRRPSQPPSRAPAARPCRPPAT